VLLVDDDADVRSSTANTLDALGYTVVEAANGTSALALLSSVSPDLALLDYAMPEMSGAVLAKAIRARTPTPPSCSRAALRIPMRSGTQSGRTLRSCASRSERTSSDPRSRRC
jgi:CheY-like chemotaxis protein